MSEENGTYDISYNLFNYGYKELTQDAFICWLIKWAYYNGTKDEGLKIQKCGLDFVNALFAKHGKEAPHPLEPDKVKIWQQDNSIDVLARIGKYVLLVEDKTGTKEHGKQLNDYYKKVLNEKTKAGKVNKEDILPIYLKTGNQPLGDKLRIEGSTEYKVFERKDFLDVIKPCYEAHSIISDFYNHLMHKEEATNSYEKWRENDNENKEINYWSSCEGFFRELENHLVVINKDNSMVGFDEIKNTWKRSWSNGNLGVWGWDRVNNRSGGFFGFWWYFKTVESCEVDVAIYLQLEIKHDKPEDGKLCFKVDAGELDKGLRSKIKWDCHSRILKAGNKLLRKPNVMRIGRWMTVAQWDVQCKDGHKQNPWLIFNNANGGPDIPAIIKNLIEAQSILDRV
ncbi:MAG: PD-(D/E)XK nuclease family protein [Gammaproteobacteria bacterium]|nr:PD-(D/E)XK nuclease family protein [Gammaproteobacteria bacterium]MDE0285603.1 PD-(D/E)XK nuclease family protein [Gammaproteobacteria bacterium]